MAKQSNNQSVINGEISRLFNKDDELREFMKDKTDEQKRLGRKHFKTVRALRGKK